MAVKFKVLAPDSADKHSETFGESTDICELKEPWSEYVLEDGTKIEAKQAVVNIAKLEQKNPDGTLVYILWGQPIEINRSILSAYKPPKNLQKLINTSLIGESGYQKPGTNVRKNMRKKKSDRITARKSFDISNKYDDYAVLFSLGNGGNVFIGWRPVVDNADIENVFNELYTKWRENTKFHSHIGSSTDVYHERIVQLGWEVVPFIIKKLREDCAHLFIALSRITGENPVKKENMGKVKKMAEDWIQWWEEREHGMG